MGLIAAAEEALKDFMLIKVDYTAEGLSGQSHARAGKEQRMQSYDLMHRRQTQSLQAKRGFINMLKRKRFIEYEEKTEMEEYVQARS